MRFARQVLFVFACAFVAQVVGGASLASDSAVEAAWIESVQRDIAAEEYEVTWRGETALRDLEAAYQAPNRRQGLRTYFVPEGIRVIPRHTESGALPAWEWSLRLLGYGTGGRRWELPSPQLTTSGNRVEYARGGLIEWYVNRPEGLKHGFTLEAPPEALARQGGFSEQSTQVTRPGRNKRAKEEQALVHLDLGLAGDLRPKVSSDGQVVDFLESSGVPALRYDGLVVVDATGRPLESWMEGAAEFGGIRIVFDDRDAIYPITVDPVATTPAWTVDGEGPNGKFGRVVATAGDVNGDGYSDAIVGAPEFDGGQSSAGRAYVYLGSPAGLAITPTWFAEGDGLGASLGSAVSTAGDVNGDGFADIIVGARFRNGDLVSEGAAYLYLGSAVGPEPTAAWSAEGDQNFAYFGSAVATAGDVDGDGFSDVIVGAFGFDNGESNEGRAFLYRGSASGLEATPSWTAEGDVVLARFAIAVATAGDVNGDGFSDVIVGADNYSGSGTGGAAFVYLGSATGLAAAPSWTAESDRAAASFGASVGTAGDVNGDGYADVIVGAPSYDGTFAGGGRALVYLGSDTGLGAAAAWTVEGGQENANLGRSAATAGDVNGDGYADVIVGAPFFDGAEFNDGRVSIYLGSPSGLATAAVWSEGSGSFGSAFGLAVATAGDVNGDGYADVIVGAPDFLEIGPGQGRAYLFLGSATGPESTVSWSDEGNVTRARFGFSVASAGDVNGDGFSDVIVGAYNFDTGNFAGRASVYLGSETGVSDTAVWEVTGDDRSTEELGFSVASAGDVNGDGFGDVIIGVGEVSELGVAWVYAGSATGQLTLLWGENGNRCFGCSVASAGDVNGDGYSDVIVGEPNSDNAYLFLGGAGGLPFNAGVDGDRAGRLAVRALSCLSR